MKNTEQRATETNISGDNMSIVKSISANDVPTARNSDQIFSYLLRDIVELRIRPGEKLSENALAAQFHVSRTIIRASLQRLAQEGFVRIVPHSGSIVTKIHPEIAQQIIYMRVSVETSVLKDFIRSASSLEMEELKHRYQSHRERCQYILEHHITDNKDINELFNLDMSFHKTYFEFTNKEYIWSMLMTPQPDYSRLLRLDMLDGMNLPEVQEQHAELMRIIEKGETDKIEPLLSLHFNGSIRRLGKLLFSEDFKNNLA